jgi:hypothetical protein
MRVVAYSKLQSHHIIEEGVNKILTSLIICTIALNIPESHSEPPSVKDFHKRKATKKYVHIHLKYMNFVCEASSSFPAAVNYLLFCSLRQTFQVNVGQYLEIGNTKFLMPQI